MYNHISLRPSLVGISLSVLLAACSQGRLSGTDGPGGPGTGDPDGGPSGPGPSWPDPEAPELEATHLEAIPSNGAIGVEWEPIEGATAYRLRWSTESSVDPDSAFIEVDRTTFVHRGRTNGQTHRYVVTAVGADGEGPPSNVAAATPGGDWVLEELGSGIVDSIVDEGFDERIPIEQRQHILIYAEGYMADDLSAFHDDFGHEGERNNDVDRWVDEVFRIEPYSFFREAFVVWYLPAESDTHIGGGGTAFDVAVDVSNPQSPITQSISSSGETAARAWAALDTFPYPSSDRFTQGRIASLTAAFLIYVPARGRAGVSGRALTLQNPEDSQERLSAGFGVGHAHEFTHAFSLLRDEYINLGNSSPSWSATSNVVPTNVCGELPWDHLMAGGPYNPDVEELVGAFGTEAQGYHSELLCLMNGTHQNADIFGGPGLLRVGDRMCNFCREITAFRVFERSRILPSNNSFSTWEDEYRPAFYDAYGFVVPNLVPQSNNVRSPGDGDTVYYACSDQ